MISRTRTLPPTTFVLAAALLLGGCLERKLKPLNPCLVSGVVAEISVTNIDKVDLLFLVDSSGSMKQEQDSLRAQLPPLVNTLTSGMRSDGTTFPPAGNLHLGVITSDMGLVGVDGVMGCQNGFGDDGILKNTPGAGLSGCQPSYNPPFIAYRANMNDPAQTATDFGCLAAVGTMGCGYEQQLEAMLKAVWPLNDIDPATGVQWVDPATGQPGNRIPFLGDANGAGTTGHGDGANAGFLRNNPVEGISLIALVMVTDEEDCSSSNTHHFTPAAFLNTADPVDAQLAMQDPNLRCFYNGQNLHLLQRYVDGYRALRPDNQNLVIFALIAGVPPDLVTPDRIKAVDFGDEAERNSFYDSMLVDPRMTETLDPTRPAGSPTGQNLTPSCDEPGRGVAYPPRRMVEVARQFGPSGIVQSICQDDFGPAMDLIIDIIAKQLGAVCLPRPLVRNSDGLVSCDVVWELPKPGKAAEGTPTSCAEKPYLLQPEEGRPTVSETGGAICRVAQLAVKDVPPDMQNPEGKAAQPTDGFMDGWFYDNYSTEVKTNCLGASRQRVTFTNAAKPGTGVTVKLECLNETQSLTNNRTDILTSVTQPAIGSPCKDITRDNVKLTGDPACAVRLNTGMMDTQMFCHPKQQVCVLGCETDVECAAGWACDNRPETLSGTIYDMPKTPEEVAHNGMYPNGRPYCVNPTCGDGK